MMNILSVVSTFDGTYPNGDIKYEYENNLIELWTGKQILSYILPKNIQLSMQNNNAKDNNDSINYFSWSISILECCIINS